MKVVLTDQVFPSTDVERAILGEAGASLDVLPEASPDAIKKAAKDADGVLTTYAPLDRSTIESLERCKIIARYGIGVDNIDLDAAKERGIAVTNVPDYCVEEVADHTLGLILALTRKVVLGHRFVREGGWGIGALRPVHRLRGKTLGLVGLGHIGEAVAIRAQPLGLKIDIFDPYVDDAKISSMGGSLISSLHELLATCPHRIYPCATYRGNSRDD
jgi:D-3-phosphoglycerate dehydrogenase